ncbi:hypothetical protein E4U15_000097 [Claviceps sp. LM218 group G6]|nr:hypothetical protein E4U15_000097 [Claviceps sp. LM218 group G6]
MIKIRITPILTLLRNIDQATRTTITATQQSSHSPGAFFKMSDDFGEDDVSVTFEHLKIEDEEPTEFFKTEVDQEDGRIVNSIENDDENDANHVVVSSDSPAPTAAVANNPQNNKDPIKDLKIPKDERTMTPYMTKFERARILGTRAMQISMNAPVLVDLEGETDPLEIALKELREKKLPMIVRRYHADGSYEDWSCEELRQQDW